MPWTRWRNARTRACPRRRPCGTNAVNAIDSGGVRVQAERLRARDAADALPRTLVGGALFPWLLRLFSAFT